MANAGVSRSTFAEAFAELVGEPPFEYITRWRMQIAAERFAAGERSVAAVAEAVGYLSEIAFAKTFESAFGMTPSQFRKSMPSA